MSALALLVLASLVGPHPGLVRASTPIDLSGTPSVRIASWEAFGAPEQGLLVRACFRSDLANGYDVDAADDLVLGKVGELARFALSREGAEIPDLALTGTFDRDAIRGVDQSGTGGAVRTIRAFEGSAIVVCFVAGTLGAKDDVSRTSLEGAHGPPPRPSLALRTALSASKNPKTTLVMFLGAIALMATWIVRRRARPAF